MQWIIMAVLTAAAAFAVLSPLYRRLDAAGDASAGLIYRDQLQTLDAEAARGVVAPAEAEAARTEIARRLLRAEAGQPAADTASPSRLKLAALAGVVALPLLSLGLYVALGAPGEADRPLAARLTGDPDPRDIAAMVGRVERHVAAQPDDGNAWRVLGPIYARLGRDADAAKAFGNAARLLPPDANRHTDHGEALMRAADGAVTPEAMAAFDAALRLDPKQVRARFYKASGLGQADRKEDALAAWQALLADAPPAGAPWVDAARAELAKLGGTPARGPSAADVAAAATMSEADRNDMISGMVASLAERLESQPDDPEGWTRLIRSYVVLGRTDDAKKALAKARTGLAGKADRLAALDGLAKTLKLE